MHCPGLFMKELHTFLIYTKLWTTAAAAAAAVIQYY
jgi:hypothetical protein